MKTPITILLATLALPALAGEPAGIHFTHHDWEVACDNTRTCRAAGYQSEETAGPAISVLLERKAGPRQPVKALLQTGTYDENAPEPKRAPTLRIDGKPLGEPDLADDGNYRLTAAQTAALLAALPKNSKLQWTDGTTTWTLSGKGAAAVLLKMDEFQGRLGTAGALVRKGAKSEDAVLAPLPAPEVSPASAGSTEVNLAPAARTALLRELRGTLGADDCDALQADQLMALRLTTDKLLIQVPCWAGAYNEGSAYWVTNKAAPYAPTLVTLAASDYAAGTISASQKGRGLGDCWSKQEWTWDGRRFAPTLAATTGMCRLVAAGGAWELPTWVARVTRGLR